MAKKGINVKKGDVFGKLVALDDDELINGRRFVLCKCECGTIRNFRTDRLISGITRGCGCNKTPRIECLIGNKYGHLTILGLANTEQPIKYLSCLCDCGNQTIKPQFKVLNGTVTTCGKCKFKLVQIGDKYGKWCVVGSSIKSHGRIKWLCQCSCEKHTIRYVDEYTLKSGKSTCCGCGKRQIIIPKSRCKYNEDEKRLYRIWQKMKERCNNPSNKDFKDYGARGICICNEWDNNFENFKDWALANGYDNSLSIDRIDVNKKYEPSNCRWVNQLTQCNNKRNNICFEYEGVVHTATEWGRILNINPNNMYRYYHKGLTLEEIIKKKGVNLT